jgi:DNA (cytosine-5)-methyltransferase 3A
MVIHHFGVETKTAYAYNTLISSMAEQRSKFVPQYISPRFFIYENVASMPANIKRYISEELGAEPILINSALVSAQSRKRLYWTNIPNITQPDDKSILLKDVLVSGLAYQDKSHCITATYDGAVFWNSLERRQRSMIAEPVRVGEIGKGGQGNRIYSIQGKSVSLMATGGGRESRLI